MPEPVTFTYNPDALPSTVAEEIALIGAIVLQMERKPAKDRVRIMAYLNSLYGGES